MKHLKRRVLILAFVFSLSLSFTSNAETNGSWKQLENKSWNFIQNGKVLKSRWIYVKNKWYYLDSNGILLTNTWFKDTNGEWYYFASSGEMYLSQWLYYKNTWYYFNRSGEMVTNDFITYKGNKYYFNSDGEMVSNRVIKEYWINQDGKAIKLSSINGFIKDESISYYYINGNKVKNNWIKDNKGEWYYFGANGGMYTNQWVYYKNIWYYFNKNGEMVTDSFINYKGKKYYLNKNGEMVVNKEIKGYSINEKGEATKIENKNGFIKEGNSTYYYINSKKVINNWVKDYRGEWYYFGEKGEMYRSQWIYYKNIWYYFNRNGEMVTDDFIDYAGKKYYFNKNGEMVVNKEVKGYSINEKGEATKIESKNGFVKEGSLTYYYSDGKKVTNSWVKDYRGEWYYFGEKGEMYTSRWIYYKNVWYYFNRKGEMVTNDFVDYAGKKYYFDSDGKMVTNREVQGYWINEKGEAVKKSYLNGTFVKKDGKIYYYLGFNVVKNSWIEKNGKKYFAGEDGVIKTGFARDNEGVMRYFSIVDGEMQTNLFAYDKKTHTGYNIDKNGVGVKSNNPRQDFINMVKPHVLRVVKEKGLFPSVAIAQISLETGYGSSTLGYPPVYNLFGIKAPNGAPESEYVAVLTTEYGRNGAYQIVDKFKKFKNYEDAFNYYANLFTKNAWLTKYYKPVIDAKTPEEAAAALTGRYATDPNYGYKLLQIIEKYNLKELDKQIYPNGVKP